MNTQLINSIHSDEAIFDSYECISANNEVYYAVDDKHNDGMFIGIDYIATDTVIHNEE